MLHDLVFFDDSVRAPDSFGAEVLRMSPAPASLGLRIPPDAGP